MKVNYNGETITLPDFLIVGAARAGTTFLYQTLCNHPEVFMPEEKEPMFFYNWNKPLPYCYNPEFIESFWVIHNLKEYSVTYKKAKNHQLCGEASTWYLTEYETVISNIKELYGDQIDKLKIIIVLRNPVTRLTSHFLKKASEEKEYLSIEEAVSEKILKQRAIQNITPSYQYINQGMYSKQVEAYLNDFRNVKVYVFEEVFKDVQSYVKDVFEFLEIDFNKKIVEPKIVNASGMPKNKVTSFFNKILFRQSILKTLIKSMFPLKQRKKLKLRLKSYLVKKQPIEKKVIDQLYNVYKEDVSNLEKILNRSLDIWKDQTWVEK